MIGALQDDLVNPQDADVGDEDVIITQVSEATMCITMKQLKKQLLLAQEIKWE